MGPSMIAKQQADGTGWERPLEAGTQPVDRVIPSYRSFKDQFQSGIAANCALLSVRERFISVLASLTLLRQPGCLREKLGIALDQGLPARAISEVILQTGIYGGLPITEEASLVADAVFAERNIKPDPENLPPESIEMLKSEAYAYRSVLHGDRAAEAHADPEDHLTSKLYQIAATYGYGLVWRRPGLSARNRIIVALASFATLGSLDDFFAKFANSAISHGFSRDEIVEIVIQISPYIGFPRGLRALRALGSETGWRG